MSGRFWLVAIAFANGGDLVVRRVRLLQDEVERLKALLSHLFGLGHVAAFETLPEEEVGWSELVEQLRDRLGTIVVDACIACGEPSEHVPPAFLVPVWPFDHSNDDAPASTARFLGLDLEMIATPSPYEELGVSLPGRSGRWLVRAAPMF